MVVARGRRRMGGERADECEERNVAGDGKTRDERERKKERRGVI